MIFDIRASEKLLGGINRESGGNIDLQHKVSMLSIGLSLVCGACGHREEISWQTTEVYVLGVCRQHRHKELSVEVVVPTNAEIVETSEMRRIKDAE